MPVFLLYYLLLSLSQGDICCYAEIGDVEGVESEIERGVDVNACDGDGWTPLHYSAKNNRWPVSRFLLEKGANINAVDNDGRSPLFRAVENSHWSMFQLLLRNGADPKSIKGTLEDETYFQRSRGSRRIKEATQETLKVREQISLTLFSSFPPYDYLSCSYQSRVISRYCRLITLH